MLPADMSMGSDISGWVPDFRAGYDQLRAQAGRLKALRGQRIVGTWAVLGREVHGRQGSKERWWNDLPVILRFADGQQLEVCWDVRDRISISWNTIDVSVSPGGWLTTFSLTWRRNGQPELTGVEGGVLTDVIGVEDAYWRGADIDLRNPDTFDIVEPTGWDASGIWLKTSQADLHIFSWVEGNGLGNEPPSAKKHWRLFTLLWAVIVTCTDRKRITVSPGTQIGQF